jgi:NTE family protein
MLQARALVRRVTRRRLGVCLGSGTALGWAHIGVLKVLVREGVAIDCLSGSSMGSIIAAMLACGMTPEEMEELAGGITAATVDGWTDYNWPVMRDGLVKGEAVVAFLRKIFGDRRLEDLELPLLIQATDLVEGKPYYFREGSVVDAIRASVSLPGVFRPVHREGHVLADGGVHDTLPIGPLRDMGADLVLAVNTTQSPEYSPLSVAEVKGYNVFDLFLRSLEIMQTERSRWEAEEADYVMRPRVLGPSWKELHRAREIIRFGEEEAERHLDRFLAVLRAPP